MSQFWLDNFFNLFSINNFQLNQPAKIYNVLSLLIIIIGLYNRYLLLEILSAISVIKEVIVSLSALVMAYESAD